MNNLIRLLHLKQAFLYCLLTVGILSCSTEKTPKQGWYLKSYYDNNWSYTTIQCDSLQMISKQEAIVWVNGRSTKIVGEELRPLHY